MSRESESPIELDTLALALTLAAFGYVIRVMFPAMASSAVCIAVALPPQVHLYLTARDRLRQERAVRGWLLATESLVVLIAVAAGFAPVPEA